MMLVLSRRLWEKIHIGHDIVIQVVEIVPGRVRIGIDAPREVKIYREELLPLIDDPKPYAEGGAE